MLFSWITVLSQSHGVTAVLCFFCGFVADSESVVERSHVSLRAFLVFEFERAASVILLGATCAVLALIPLRLRCISCLMNTCNIIVIFIEFKIIFHCLKFLNFLTVFHTLVINVKSHIFG